MTSGPNNKSSSIAATTSLLLTAVLVLILGVAKGQDTTIVDYACNENTWGGNGAYGEIVSDVLDEVVHGVPADPNFLDYSTVSAGDDVVYGYGECSDTTSMSQCYDCMTAARSQLTGFCGDAIGGEVALVDCKIRYENYDFYPTN